MIECNCGYGPGFRHNEHDGYHTYSPDDGEVVATFFGHINGQRAILWIAETDESYSFSYKKCGGKPGAYLAIVAEIKARLSQTNLF